MPPGRDVLRHDVTPPLAERPHEEQTSFVLPRWPILPCLLAACSTPQPVTATKDPATTATTAISAPTPSNAIDAPRTLKFSFAVSSEISCSQSFEDDSTLGIYELTLTPPHDAKLVFTRIESHVFGSNPFAMPGSAGAPTRSETRSVATFEGTVSAAGATLAFALKRDPSECTKADDCQKPLLLTCKDDVASVVTFDAKGKHVGDRSVVRCSPDYGLPYDFHEAGWKGGLAFADGSGLFLDYEKQGPMEHPPELRPAP